MIEGKNRITEIFDVLFIMILCFATLLSAMLMRGKVLVGSGNGGGRIYDFSAGTFALTFLSLGIYLVFIVARSDRELAESITLLYGEKADQGGVPACPDSASAARGAGR
jgi:hypothetical protein